ncbi:hypothetical protein CC85DRAFT_287734 [Cutaneotrichosporon oleaginosum]|uniref:VWFA domain-containing protein n=1 Tax=Cutaneotrichosporon oleaginosum TaxID=879819 RepID=A0A0J0XGQ7_9TREE|nr:uncharacterized protein CC85DRAFT_287734 [Cutaneotrichosporon oleaginosum]KLT40212.1 hypothetical protein CC85DRAFT_287734 [Cutaneotrichosporon oleaginosum]TXT10498.1 hypothetical protein COLE_04432 [Cutaneotrichosporon oleaginosum]
MYVDTKLARGKSRGYVVGKLDRLEVFAPPVCGGAFVLVRDFYGYPASKYFTAPAISVTFDEAPPAYVPYEAPPVLEVAPPVPPPATTLSAAPESPRSLIETEASPPVPPPSAAVLIAPASPPIAAAAPAPASPQGPGTAAAVSAAPAFSAPSTASSSHTRSASHRLSNALSALKLSCPAMAASTSPIDRSSTSSPAPIVVNGEHALEMLRDFDTVFVVDDSSSMRMDGRWEQACAAVRGVVHQACKYDDDGVDVYFLNAKRDREGVRRPADVDRLFQGLRPTGMTPTGRTLEKILRDYMRRLEAATAEERDDAVKPLNVIVITDGAPTDDPESVIVSIAKRLDRGDYPLSQVGIQFFQVGDDPEATAALQELDDELSATHDIRDMVDTVPYAGELTPETIVKVLLGGVNRRLDRRGRV